MFGLLALVLLYFLPSILGHDKRDGAGIFLLNLLLGWTIIGWVAAMIWACNSAPARPVLVFAGPGRYCTSCGTPCVADARFCGACGRPL
jgi:hypothetical protein